MRQDELKGPLDAGLEIAGLAPHVIEVHQARDVGFRQRPPVSLARQRAQDGAGTFFIFYR